VRGGPGNDQMTGGECTDTLYYSDAGSAAVKVSLAVTGGADQITGSGTGPDRLTGSNGLCDGGAGNADSQETCETVLGVAESRMLNEHFASVRVEPDGE
jgi:Ca2+-binding RTX toxin-like protein